MTKKIIFTLIGLLALVGLLAGTKVLQFQTMFAQGASFTPPPETVTTAEVKPDRWQPTLTAIGSITAVQGVMVSAEISGTVKNITFESGATVKTGELLVELDTAIEEAQLRSAAASADLARANLDRARTMRDKNMGSAADFDAAEAQAKQAVAQIDNIRAAIAKKTIRAPFAGRLGIRKINLGQFLDNGAAMVTLQSLDPVYVDFALPQRYLAQLRAGMTVRVAADAFPTQNFEGRITAISPEVDSVTRNVRLQATLANPKGRLQPGMYVEIAAVLPETEQILMIPATAVLYAPYGDSVFVLEDKKDEKTGAVAKVLNQKFVRLGPTRGDFVVVASGVEAGQILVSTGVFKLRNGMSVVVDNALAPQPQLAPKPANS
ncbi:MAG TPA: efflux RND transporter periplasmic adaptor subunit [Candidatus Competibacteraceae bacterium]|nr:efflux RND transporter periplasmic adaptor subunit [Candidatus Competibacter sp.]MDG4605317.1 efflux RND transporter periplasmic adaptor subunit [Candidatus Contendobacter sp.]HRD49116.1 efflux RND transporter periplasmic adaptor subunit [Candidatus Contendobacter sp.]HRF45059.1 efflux RND transporter periplasmic adaptor subunit [Candidatus Competibacteraceae bacterium]